MDSLEQITIRLAQGSVGRTEADIQSDVRKFLLDAPLDLDGEDLDEVRLESQAGGGRRIDVETGNAVIEVKKSLASPKVLADARVQLAGYVRTRCEETGQRFVGILTDGQNWLLHHLRPDNELAQVGQFQVAGAASAAGLGAWLEVILATRQQLEPTPQVLLDHLGARSPAFALDLADLRAVHTELANNPELKLKKELWSRLLVAALGTNFEATDDLFITHTYLVLTAELIAHAVAGIPLDVPHRSARDLVEGQQFALAGLHGVVEADFFDWPAIDEVGAPLIRAIARKLSRFDWSKVDHDILKALYESVIDADTRHKLGEYYTPDWLAHSIVEEVVDKPLEQRVLDPACGSGTFLFWTVRRVLEAAEADGISSRDAVSLVVQRVHGIDLHPVAVTLARVTYLLAIGRDRLQDRGEITIPVFLGDSIRWEQDTSLTQQGGITIRTSDELELVHQDLHFPEGVLQDPARFDRLVAALAKLAADPERRTVDPPRRKDGKTSTKTARIPEIAGILRAHSVAEGDRDAVTSVFAKLCRLHDAGRDHIWGYYIRNLARPLSFARNEGRVDRLIGNPPWLAYRHMPPQIQERYKALAKPRGLWAGGKNATHQDLSDLFVARTVEQYLKVGGQFAYVMPFAVLSRRQYEGFRSADWTSQGGGSLGVRSALRMT